MTLALVLSLALVSGLQPSPAPARVIEALLGWAVEGRSLPHRSCGGLLDPEHLPTTIYVAWDLSAEAQHAACNWKYDVASRRATPLTPAEAADVANRIVAGTVAPQERAFFHSVPQRDGALTVTVGYCWGSAKGTFAPRADGTVLVGELVIHGY